MLKIRHFSTILPGLWIGVERLQGCANCDFKKHDGGPISIAKWAGDTTDQFGVGAALWLGLNVNCVVINSFNEWEIKNCNPLILDRYPFICQRNREPIA